MNRFTGTGRRKSRAREATDPTADPPAPTSHESAVGPWRLNRPTPAAIQCPLYSKLATALRLSRKLGRLILPRIRRLMEPAQFEADSPLANSRITAAQQPEYGINRAWTSRSTTAAGNGIFGYGDRTPKIAAAAFGHLQRPKSEKSKAENPRRNALFGVRRKTYGLRRLDGGGSRAQTGDPPPSHRTGLRRRAGNGNLRCRDGLAKGDLSPSRDQSRDAQECKKPPFRRNKCEKACGSLSPTTGWWAHQGSNLGPDD
jgi:hypothetical protein